jgi:tetratricopeptide (TPR) repeat protein
MRRNARRTLATLAALAVLGTLPPTAGAQGLEACGSIENAYGPYDYRTITEFQRQLVEGAHFTPQVESLQRGIGNRSLGGDIDYTLRAFPNHPRALLAMKRLGEREKRAKVRGATYPVECYFDRAVRFAPDDPAVRVVFAHYLIDRGDKAGAGKQLELVQGKVDDDANLSYNVGLAYFDLKDYARAREHAKRAYALGFPLQGLKKKLQQAKQWQD